MQPVIAFLKAIRSPNLFIIALVMYCLRWLILKPLIELHELKLQLSELDFSLLLLSVVLVAAAGNIINDYFDLKIDRYNKPERVLIGKYVKRRIAMISHIVMNGIALIIAIYVSYKCGVMELALIHVIWISSLWFYSTNFKRKFLWGNIVIAFCTGLVPFSIALFEIPPLVANNQDFLAEYPQAYPYFKGLVYSIFYWSLGFGVFAFLMTLAREMTKDIIDMEGDEVFGCKTLPVVLGIKKTAWIIVAIYASILIAIFSIQQTFLDDKYSLAYLAFIFSPLVLWAMYLTIKGSHKSHFNLPALLNKIASVVGILYAVVAFLILSGRI